MPDIMKNPETKNEPTIESLSSMDEPKKVGLSIFFLIFGLFGLWSTIAPPDGRRSHQERYSQPYNKVVQYLEGGIVADILVRDGDQFKSTTIVALDGPRPGSSLEIVNNNMLRSECRRLISRETS